LELLLFSVGKVAPDGGSIGIATLADIFQNAGCVVGCCAIGFSNGGTDKAKAFDMGSSI
jgi:hypothetical protein